MSGDERADFFESNEADERELGEKSLAKQTAAARLMAMREALEVPQETHLQDGFDVGFARGLQKGLADGALAGLRAAAISLNPASPVELVPSAAELVAVVAPLSPGFSECQVGKAIYHHSV